MSKKNILLGVVVSVLFVGAAVGVYIFQNNAAQERVVQEEALANMQKSQESIDRGNYYKEQLKRFDNIGR